MNNTNIERLHSSYIQKRRINLLSMHISRLIPYGANVLDVGCGDGQLAINIAKLRKDISISGIDVLERKQSYLPVTVFDGNTIPFATASFDIVLLIDVLHHTNSPKALLEEAKRVSNNAIILKDHLMQGIFGKQTLHFMDLVGNARYGVASPANYLQAKEWTAIFSELNLIGDWTVRLKLYPWPASILFDRSLHFITYLKPDNRIRKNTLDGQTEWEQAYLKFETPKQEQRKFRNRLLGVGCDEWPRESKIVELFCGRGSSIKALTNLGFNNVEGVDLSIKLLNQYQGPAKTHQADCRELPFDDGAVDIVIIQGGLHHLEKIPEDLEKTLIEINRVLKGGGTFIAIEPWLTGFLKLVHFFCGYRLFRLLYPKLGALATMIDHEADTYYAWLSLPEIILKQFEKYFYIDKRHISFGKIKVCGRKR